MRALGYYRDDDTFVPIDDGDEREHFIQCPGCLAWVDCRDLGDVMQHVDPGHPAPPLQ